MAKITQDELSAVLDARGVPSRAVAGTIQMLSAGVDNNGFPYKERVVPLMDIFAVRPWCAARCMPVRTLSVIQRQSRLECISRASGT
jgi:hypothetical protein